MSEDEKTKLLWWFAAIFIGSIGANQGINKMTPAVRYDAFTATDGKVLGSRISKIESEHNVVMYRLNTGRSREHDRIADLENDMKHCKKMIKQHNEKK